MPDLSGYDPTLPQALSAIADKFLVEQRRARRSAAFWKGLLALYLGGFILAGAFAAGDNWRAAFEPHAAVVKIEGTIDADSPGSAEHIGKGLRKAFENENVRAVLLDIDSPGGSPVQAERVADELVRLKKQHPDIPVVAVIGDTGASAAYFIASAADTIYAGRASLVGSIGVRIDSFGFTQAMQELGIERRLFVAGENKGLLDMFSPVSDTAKTHVHRTLERIHGQFIEAVKRGRGVRLKDDPTLFTGLFWSGEDAVQLGLVDKIGDQRSVLEALGIERTRDYTSTDLVSALSKGLGASFGWALASLTWTWH